MTMAKLISWYRANEWLRELIKDLISATWFPALLLAMLITLLFLATEYTIPPRSQHEAMENMVHDNGAQIKANGERLERIEAELRIRREELNKIHAIQDEHQKEQESLLNMIQKQPSSTKKL
jgi:hypothetical protein